MAKDFKQFEQRKQDHIELALMAQNQASDNNPLDAMTLMHEALPDLDFTEINISTTRFGHHVDTPFLVSSMTAGHPDANAINRHLISACADRSWAMGVGSQRRELTDPLAKNAWHTLRHDFPEVSLFSNLGIAQLITTPLSQVQHLIDALAAEALIVHCNPLQESIQPEGTPQFKGCWQAISACVEALSVPVIVKETGCGFSKPTLNRLNDIGVAAVDVSGLGGTHWGRIEGHRAPAQSLQHRAAQTFADWGIPTSQCVLDGQAFDFETWGSGGVRNGLDAAKLIALGAQSIGFAKPLLQAALESAEEVIQTMAAIEYELRVAMFCTGCDTLDGLKEKICR